MNKLGLLVDDDPIFNWVSTKLIEIMMAHSHFTSFSQLLKIMNLRNVFFSMNYWVYLLVFCRKMGQKTCWLDFSLKWISRMDMSKE